MAIGTVFENNRTQAVRLPVETRFPEGVKKVLYVLLVWIASFHRHAILGIVFFSAKRASVMTL